MAVATKRGIRYHPQGAACRGEAPPRPYVLVVYPHVIDGLGPLFIGFQEANRRYMDVRRCGILRLA